MGGIQVEVDDLWSNAKPNEQGLVPCVVQDLRSRAVLMMAWVSKQALEHSLRTGYATFWSRSQQKLWEKGASSGNRQRLVHVRLDCDGDTLLYLVEAQGPACHEGHDTCFTRRRVGAGWRWEPEFVLSADGPANPRVLLDLEQIVASRAAADGSPTKTLLDAGNAVQRSQLKTTSEALGHALGADSTEDVARAAADLLYHLAVALKGREVSMSRVFEALSERVARSIPAADQ